MSYTAYKLIHFLGIFTLITALAATCMHVLRGGTRADYPHRRLAGITHGIATFLILLGGFGMLARLEMVQGGLPGWIYAKLVIWGVLGFGLMAAYRGERVARAVLVALPLLTLVAAATALLKPF